MQLKKIEASSMQQKEKEIEDRKDKRTKLQASQQSEMIAQRKNDGLPINFDSPIQPGGELEANQFTPQ